MGILGQHQKRPPLFIVTWRSLASMPPLWSGAGVQPLITFAKNEFGWPAAGRSGGSWAQRRNKLGRPQLYGKPESFSTEALRRPPGITAEFKKRMERVGGHNEGCPLRMIRLGKSGRLVLRLAPFACPRLLHISVLSRRCCAPIVWKWYRCLRPGIVPRLRKCGVRYGSSHVL